MSELPRDAGGPVSRALDTLALPSAFASVVAAYYLAAAAIRLLVLTGSSGDEAQLMLYAQEFALGYDLVNLPLKGWLGATVEAVIGPGLEVALVVRYGMLAALFVVGHAVAREALGDRRLALVAAIAPVGFFFIGWESLRNFADTLVMIVVMMTTIGIVLRLARIPTTPLYCALAAVMAAGLLAKYTYPPALGLLIAAGFATPQLRRVFLDWRFGAGLVAALAAASPAYLWALDRFEALRRAAETRLVDSAGSTLGDSWHVGSVFTALDAAAGFVLPLLPLFLLVFGADYMRRWALHQPPIAPVTARWLGLYLALVLVVGTMICTLAGLERIREHYMFVLVPLPLWLAALLPTRVGLGRIATFVGTCIVLSVTALGVLAGQITTADDCGKCRLLMPWQSYADQLRSKGFERGTIVSFDSPFIDIGPNLRRHLPDTRVWSTKRPYVVPPPLVRNGDCLIVWNQTRAAHVLDEIRQDTVPELGAPLPSDAQVGLLRAPLAWSKTPAPIVGYALLKGGSGTCR